MPGFAEMVELDLSAFEPESRYDALREVAARSDDIRRPGRVISSQSRARPQAGSVGAQHRYKTVAEKPKRASDLAEAGGLAEKPARPEHLHAQRSPEARKEKSRANCKERPTPTKGSGRSRKFIPWCDRKR